MYVTPSMALCSSGQPCQRCRKCRRRRASSASAQQPSTPVGKPVPLMPPQQLGRVLAASAALSWSRLGLGAVGSVVGDVVVVVAASCVPGAEAAAPPVTVDAFDAVELPRGGFTGRWLRDGVTGWCCCSCSMLMTVFVACVACVMAAMSGAGGGGGGGGECAPDRAPLLPPPPPPRWCKWCG